MGMVIVFGVYIRLPTCNQMPVLPPLLKVCFSNSSKFD